MVFFLMDPPMMCTRSRSHHIDLQLQMFRCTCKHRGRFRLYAGRMYVMYLTTKMSDYLAVDMVFFLMCRRTRSHRSTAQQRSRTLPRRSAIFWPKRQVDHSVFPCAARIGYVENWIDLHGTATACELGSSVPR